MTVPRRHLQQHNGPALASAGVAALMVVLTAASLALAYLNKARCVGAPFSDAGRSLRFAELKNELVCYSDIQLLWLNRGIDQHLFPYINGGFNEAGALVGGTVEYPVLSGLLMWLGAARATTDAEFLLHSALLLAPFGLATAWLLGMLAGRWALWWAASPLLVLYGFHNWELPVVLTSVAAIAVMVIPRWPLRRRAVVAAVLLGIGFCLKLYPGIFVLPLMLFTLTGGVGGRELPSRRFDVRGAAMVGFAATATVVVVNAPFAILGFEGWRASFEFQSHRRADVTTNSIWYWGVRHLVDGRDRYDALVAFWSPTLVVASFLLAAAIGWLRYRRGGTYPWIGVSAAMVCGFLLLHKVHSPQFALWLLPFFVLLRVPWPLVVGYLAANLALGVGVFRFFYDLSSGIDPSGGSELATLVGVWGQAVGLVVLYVVFLFSPPRFAAPSAKPTGRPRASAPRPVSSLAPTG